MSVTILQPRESSCLIIGCKSSAFKCEYIIIADNNHLHIVILCPLRFPNLASSSGAGKIKVSESPDSPVSSISKAADILAARYSWQMKEEKKKTENLIIHRIKHLNALRMQV